MTAKNLEPIAVIFASIVAAFASVIGLFVLWEIQAQSVNAEQQLAQIEKQSELLGKQIIINEKLISNDSSLTFLTLLETMKPEWKIIGYDTAIGGQIGYEKFNKDTIVIEIEISNESRLALVISKWVRVSMRSCVTGLPIYLGGESDAGSQGLDTKLLARTATISPGETATVWFSIDSVEAPKMAEAIRGEVGEFFIEFSALVFTEGAETVGGFLGESDGLDSYFVDLYDGDKKIRSPFLAKTMRFQTWITSDGRNITHSDTTQDCTTDQLGDLLTRSSR